ncbi:trans-aconitate 2-methyltransferase [Pedobacter sp. UBA5917]|jgi:trans-aconitate 2-methyltransferase|uniref:trans-aconitate 2-methyltransferase n=1 Tax=Pedobacter sp. UBA5917 TaxID=1947061 RepID=UPI0025FF301C|nr:trans-aconitate 2-methyltransferase [Pedobacter sp. UBA5917]
MEHLLYFTDNLNKKNMDTNKTDTWSAGQYTKFENERNRPVTDLLNHIPANTISKAIDIGCGPGNSTELLKARFPNAHVSGIDSSADMIQAAKKRLPNIQFDVVDITQWQDTETYDLIFANAALQWVPDHVDLFPKLIQKLNKGGVLAVQMPDNFEEPTHRLMRTVACEDQWKDKLLNATKRVAREGADWYYANLRDKVTTIDIWRTTYFHPLQGGAKAIIEWLKGTGLRPYLNALNENKQLSFLDKYEEELSKAYHIFDDGTVLLPFPRLFIVAVK